MPKKTPGRLHEPPDQSEFDKLELDRLCVRLPPRSYLRLHSVNAKTGKPWPVIFFSRRGNSRFDPPSGPGTLYAGETFAGILMEIFDDKWGPIGHPSRSITAKTLAQWHVSTVHLPSITLFDATGPNLSKIGTDANLLSARYEVTQKWALRLAAHPVNLDGIYYPSRHDPSVRNVALFDRRRKAGKRPSPIPPKSRSTKITFSRATRLSDDPGTLPACGKLEVAILP